MLSAVSPLVEPEPSISSVTVVCSGSTPFSSNFVTMSSRSMTTAWANASICGSSDPL
ncbi:hypothetical protein D3C71_2183400 [compost metagenome]